jgi:uncharacterized protein YprB with RNaseH-like and TPR domain
VTTPARSRLQMALDLLGKKSPVGAVGAADAVAGSSTLSPPASEATNASLAVELTESGWREEAPLVYVRDVEGVDQSDPSFAPRRGPRQTLLPDGARREDCVFYDTETTGFGGAGAVVFLVGLGWWEGVDFRFRQVFLADYPGEREFLRYIKEQVSRFRVFVSYNGKSFDSHILRSRLVLSGMTMAFGFQLDLLHVARRLWRGITVDCRLTTIERHVLGLERSGDIPGWMVPEVYFDCLRSGRLGAMAGVFGHNKLDVVTLAHLLDALDALIAGRDLGVPTDAAALGNLLLQRGEANAVDVLSRAYAAGQVEAGRMLSLHYKRCSETEHALRLWQDMFDAHGSLFAAVELSKHHEHRQRDFATALNYLLPYRVLEQALGDASELGKRISRLRAKIARHSLAPQSKYSQSK